MRQFQEDLLQSVREFKAGKFARSVPPQTTAAAQARASAGISQARLRVAVRSAQALLGLAG